MSAIPKLLVANKLSDLPHTAYLLLFVLAVVIAVCDFLLFIAFEPGLQQALHIASILLPLLFWLAFSKIHVAIIKRFIPTLCFISLFSIWSYQLFLRPEINLVFIAGLIMLGMWNVTQSKFQLWVTLSAAATLLILLQLFTTIETAHFVAYALLLLSSVAINWYVGRYMHAMPASSRTESMSSADYLPETIDFQNEAEVQPVTELEADIAMVHVNHDRPDWEQVLRELNTELKTTSDVDSLLKSMLVFISGAIDMSAAAVGMIQDRSLNKITAYGPEELLHSKVLAWNNERIKMLIQTQQSTVNQQDHLKDDGSMIKLYRIDVPVISNNKTVGIVSIFRTSCLFDEYEVSLASSIVFHSMVALRQARLQEEVKRVSMTTVKKTLFTREQFIDKAKQQLELLNKPRVFSLLIIEIDHIDEVEEKYGHNANKQLYKAMVNSVMSSLRQDDFLGAYGNDGFVVLLHEADLLEAKKIAEEIRSKGSQVKCKISDAVVTSTLSIGLTTVSEQGEDMASLIRKADMGLFVAKESGRNSVKVSL